MGTIADNIVHFARTLRRAGFPLGSGHIVEALRAVEATGLTRRDDVRSALFATLVTQPGQRPLFDQAFEAFWRDPELFNKALASLLPQAPMPARERISAPGARRVDDALNASMRTRHEDGKATLDTIAGRPSRAITFAMVKVLPEPVTPSSVWNTSPSVTPSTSLLIASG